MGHFIVVIAPEKMSHRCEFCGKRCEYDRTLSRHLQDVHSAGYCTKCGVTLTTLSREDHDRLFHPRDHKFTCTYCYKSFDKMVKLTNHFNEQHTLNLVRVKCDICEKTFINIYGLRAHMGRHSKGVKKPVTKSSRLSCVVCGEVFGTRDELSMHAKLCNFKLKKEQDLIDMYHVYPSNCKTFTTCASLECGNFQTTSDRQMMKHMKGFHGGRWEIARCGACQLYYYVISDHNTHSCPEIRFDTYTGKYERSVLDMFHNSFFREETSMDSLIAQFIYEEDRTRPLHIFLWKKALMVQDGHLFICRLEDFSKFVNGKVIELARIPDLGELFAINDFNLCTGKNPNPIHITSDCQCSTLRYRLRVRNEYFQRHFRKGQFDLAFFGEKSLGSFIGGSIRAVGSSHEDLSCKDNNCSHVSETFVAYVEHVREHSRNIDKFSCEHCDESFATENALKVHIKIHNKKAIKCPQCDRAFGDSGALKTHIQRNHSSGDFSCVPCGKKLFSSKGLLKHRNQFHQDTTKNFLCDRLDCGKRYDFNSSLLRHQRKYHGDVIAKPFQCDQCTKSFPQKLNLKRHFWRTHKKKGIVPEFECVECDQSFALKVGLEKHIELFHPPCEFPPGGELGEITVDGGSPSINSVYIP